MAEPWDGNKTDQIKKLTEGLESGDSPAGLEGESKGSVFRASYVRLRVHHSTPTLQLLLRAWRGLKSSPDPLAQESGGTEHRISSSEGHYSPEHDWPREKIR